jgi:hypothetical protein
MHDRPSFVCSTTWSEAIDEQVPETRRFGRLGLGVLVA